MLIEMELREVVIKEDVTASQIVVLGEKESERTFPIYIGYDVATALTMAVHGKQAKRPMTHDLIYNILDAMDARLVGVAVDDLMEETFHGKLILELKGGRQTLVDSRPSDAIVLAVKRQAPIYVEDHVLRQITERQEGEDTQDPESEEEEPE